VSRVVFENLIFNPELIKLRFNSPRGRVYRGQVITSAGLDVADQR
jgi:hypothetical protein